MEYASCRSAQMIVWEAAWIGTQIRVTAQISSSRTSHPNVLTAAALTMMASAKTAVIHAAGGTATFTTTQTSGRAFLTTWALLVRSTMLSLPQAQAHPAEARQQTQISHQAQARHQAQAQPLPWPPKNLDALRA
jgi:hypothetical protein